MEIPGNAVWVRVPRFIGDAVMIHQAIAPLRAAKCPLVVWGPGAVVDLFEGSEDYLGAVTDPARKPTPFEAARLLRVHRPKALVNFSKSARSLLAATLARVPLRVGCGDGGAWLLCTHSLPFYRLDSHFLDRYRAMLALAFPALPPEPPFRPFRPRPAIMERFERERAVLGIGTYVGFSLGAKSWSKRPGLAVFESLGRSLAGAGIRSVLLGAGAEEKGIAQTLAERIPGAVDQVGHGGMAWTSAWVSEAKALVGGDSALVHLAAACGTPALALFGPTNPRHTAPRGSRVRILRREDLPCLECQRGDCPVQGHPCMDGLDPAAVLEATLGLLSP